MKGKRAEEPLAGLPRNFLRACLLLLIGEQPAHGYDLLEQIPRLGIPHVDPGGSAQVGRSRGRAARR